jgi:hypothetical protein
LIAIFGRGHLTIKAGVAVYVTKCTPVEVVPWTQGSWGTKIFFFVDPISYVIKSAGKPVHCNHVVSLGTKYWRQEMELQLSEIQECHNPAMLPVDVVQTETIRMSYISLRKSIYTKKQ